MALLRWICSCCTKLHFSPPVWNEVTSLAFITRGPEQLWSVFNFSSHQNCQEVKIHDLWVENWSSIWLLQLTGHHPGKLEPSWYMHRRLVLYPYDTPSGKRPSQLLSTVVSFHSPAWLPHPCQGSTLTVTVPQHPQKHLIFTKKTSWIFIAWYTIKFQ